MSKRIRCEISYSRSTTDSGTHGHDAESLIEVLNAYGFTRTGSVIIDNISVYAKRAENTWPPRYIGYVTDPTEARQVVAEWFEANGPSLPE